MAKHNSKKLVLLDTHAILHRAYHALPDFSSKKGEPTGALYGFVSMVLKIAQDISPDYIVACFDLPDETFRHAVYDGYKGTRSETDDALVSQIKRTYDICNILSIPVYQYPGFEADDMLGTIVEQVKKQKDIDVVIATGDMDTLQLVDGKKVQVYTLKKGINDTILYDTDAVRDRYSFEPYQLPDYKGLAGDQSDNIVGISGIGEKTAKKIISLYTTLENLYTTPNLEESLLGNGFSPRITQLIIEGKESALFSKELAVIRRDAPINFSTPPQMWKSSVSIDVAEDLFLDLDFKTMGARLRKVLGEENITSEESIPEPKDVDMVHRLGIALWLLDSEKTNPTQEDIFDHTKTSNYEDVEKVLRKELEEKKMIFVYDAIEIPLIPLIHAMRVRGIAIDVDYLQEISLDLHKTLETLEKDIQEYAGCPVNPNSPKQLTEILFHTLHIPTKGIKKTTKGAISTKESELEKLRDAHPIVPLILRHRELQKLVSTYVDALPKLVAEDGRIHATFLQTGTTTGRFSSQNPNMQNLPTRTDQGKNIRDAFVASPGHVLVACDYSQIELRIAALMSQDPVFLETFHQGKDVHSVVASQVFGINESEITSDMRRHAKVINFGVLYGMGVSALQKNLGTTRKEAEDFYQRYFARFSSLAGYLEKTKEFAYQHGYTETLFGRRRYFPALKSKLPFIRASAERMAINAPIQGTATADIIKLALVTVCRNLEKENLHTVVHPLLQIHDELVFEIQEEKLHEAIPIIVQSMESILVENDYMQKKEYQPVPLAVKVAVGKRFGSLEKFE
jgi:DNA polymerase I-like protein with 3'-5' exonuclease and polymerase domains/5'-3' exonuclease